MTVSRIPVTITAPVLIKLAGSNANVCLDLLDLDARGISTNVCRILARILVHKLVYNWSMIISVTVSLAIPVIIVKKRRTFVLLRLVRMEEYALSSIMVTNAHARKDIMVKTVSSAGTIATPILVKMEEHAEYQMLEVMFVTVPLVLQALIVKSTL